MSKINIIDIGAVGGFDIPWKFHQDKIGKSLSFEPNEPAILTGQHLRSNTAVWNFDGRQSEILSQRFRFLRSRLDRLPEFI